MDIAKTLKRSTFNFLNLHFTSSLARVRLFKIFGAYVGEGSKIEKVIVVNYDGTDLSNLWIGDRVYIGVNCILDLKEKLTIGNSTKIAAGCNFSTHSDCGEENPIYKLYPRKKEPINIGNQCWVGLSVIIMCGISIGDNSIIGAGSLVNKNIPSNVLAFGNPAKIQKYLDEIQEQTDLRIDNLDTESEMINHYNQAHVKLKKLFLKKLYPAHRI